MNERRRSSLLETLNSPLLQSELQNLNNPVAASNDPFQLNSSIWRDNSTSPQRRSSDVVPPTLQNYTVWNQNGMNNSFTAHQGNGNSGFINSGTASTPYDDWNSPRRHSLDSYPLEFQQQQLQQQQQQTSYQQHQSLPALFDTTSPLSPPLSDSMNHPNESSPQLQQHYQTLDFYFTQDPYNRVAINQECLSNSSMDTLMSSQNIDSKSITLPKFPNNSSNLSSQQLFLVAFKSGRIDCFYLPNTSLLNLKLNDLVVVEADRGKDLGKVVKLNVTIDEFRLFKYFQFMEQQATLQSFDQSGSSQHSDHQQNNNIPALHFPKPILRLAMIQEVSQLLTKLQDEEKAKKICQFKIQSTPVTKNDQASNETLSQSMSIIDSEYQFDRKKLIFYYKANHRIDFRDLVRDLFRIYKTRIWMCAVNSNYLAYPATNPMTEQMQHLTQGLSSPVFQKPELLSSPAHQQSSYSYNTNDNMNFNQNIWSTPPQTSSSGGYYMFTSTDHSSPQFQDPRINHHSEIGLGQLGYQAQKIGGIWNN